MVGDKLGTIDNVGVFEGRPVIVGCEVDDGRDEGVEVGVDVGRNVPIDHESFVGCKVGAGEGVIGENDGE